MTTDTNPAAGRSIDVHAHTLDLPSAAEMHRHAPDAVPSFELVDGDWYASFPSGRRRTVERGVLDIETRIRDMDRQGVQYQALANWTSMYLYDAPIAVAADLHGLQNDGFVRLAREHPDRFVAMAGLPMQAPEAAADEVRRVAAISEVAGVQIATHVNGLNLDDPSFEPIWAALEESGLAVLVHPWGSSPDSSERLSRYHLQNLIGNPLETSIAIASLVFSGVMERYPKLRFGFVHGGGFMPYQLGRWDHGVAVGRSKARITAPPSEYVKRCYFDLITHSPQSLRFLIERFGIDHLVIGTDYPWDIGPSDPLGVLVDAGLADDDLRRVAWDNATAFLRWPGGRQLKP